MTPENKAKVRQIKVTMQDELNTLTELKIEQNSLIKQYDNQAKIIIKTAEKHIKIIQTSDANDNLTSVKDKGYNIGRKVGRNMCVFIDFITHNKIAAGLKGFTTGIRS